MSGLRRRLAEAWPHLRALFIAYHVAAVVILSLPPPGAMTSPALWRSANLRADIAGYAAALQRAGVDVTATELGDRLLRAAHGVAAVTDALSRPFRGYAEVVGARQGWAMFASPQRHPAELHVELQEGESWRLIYRPHDDAAAWRSATMRHNRMRKFAGRFARGFIPKNYDELARWLAQEAAADHPQATAVRVRLYRYTSLPPAEVREGQRPKGRYEHTRTFSSADLRGPR